MIYRYLNLYLPKNYYVRIKKWRGRRFVPFNLVCLYRAFVNYLLKNHRRHQKQQQQHDSNSTAINLFKTSDRFFTSFTIAFINLKLYTRYIKRDITLWCIARVFSTDNNNIHIYNNTATVWNGQLKKST